MNLLRHLRGRTHNASNAMMARALAYVQGAQPQVPGPQLLVALLPEPPQVPEPQGLPEPQCLPEPPCLPEPQGLPEPQVPEPPCCDCVAQLAAVRIDNSEYRDFFPTVDGMIKAVELLDTYQDVFPTPAHMHAYIKKHGAPAAWQ